MTEDEFIAEMTKKYELARELQPNRIWIWNEVDAKRQPLIDADGFAWVWEWDGEDFDDQDNPDRWSWRQRKVTFSLAAKYLMGPQLNSEWDYDVLPCGPLRLAESDDDISLKFLWYPDGYKNGSPQGEPIVLDRHDDVWPHVRKFDEEHGIEPDQDSPAWAPDVMKDQLAVAKMTPEIDGDELEDDDPPVLTAEDYRSAARVAKYDGGLTTSARTGLEHAADWEAKAQAIELEVERGPGPFWHVFSAYEPKSDFYAHVILGDLSLKSTDLNKSGERIRDSEIPFPEFDVVLKYVTTFDHEPSEHDKDTLAPLGHRSWEQR